MGRLIFSQSHPLCFAIFGQDEDKDDDVEGTN